MSSRAEAVAVTQVRKCLTCRREFETEGYEVGDRVVGGAAHCPGCTTKHEAEEASTSDRLLERQATSRAERILPLLHDAGVCTTEHGGATLDSFNASRGGGAALQAAREVVHMVRRAGRHDPVKGLYLFGGTGTGKSHLAVAVCRDLLLDPAIPETSIIFDRSLRIVNQIQDTYNTGASTEAILKRRFDARLWVLDDLGTEQPSADVVRRLTDILQARALRPVLITSNHAPEELEGRNPDFFRIVSRLGTRYFRTVRLEGADARFS